MRSISSPHNCRLVVAAIIALLTISSALWAEKKAATYFTSPPGAWVVTRRIDQPQLPRNPQTRFTVAEFNEQGQPWLQAQLDGVIEQIASFAPRTVLLYVHGWHNDASPDSEKKGGDMYDVDELLHQMQDVGGGKVMAIYVGWRGESKKSVFRWLTVEDRRKVARSIGSSPAFQSFLAKVAQAGRTAGANTVFAGHSLGAALMGKAARGLICSSLPDNALPNVCLLVNSAEISAEAIPDFEAINQHPRVQTHLSGSRLLSPYVIAVTSLGDTANRDINPKATLLLTGKAGTKTIGFDDNALTHTPLITPSQVINPSVVLEASRKQFQLSLRPALDPVFWAPNPDHTEILKYRLLSVANRSRSAGVWNIQIPASLSGDHNDVYNPRILAASVSWLQIANPTLRSLPDSLPKLLTSFREALRESEASDEANDRLNPYRLQLINGAALRLPYNAANVASLLSELATPSEMKPAEAKLIHRYRVNLFAILKFAQRPEDGWARGNLGTLSTLLQQRAISDALDEAGVEERDSNLSAFKIFLRRQGVLATR